MRYERGEVEKRGEIVYVTITVVQPVRGSEIRVGPNTQFTNTVSNHTWQFKEGQLFNDKGQPVADFMKSRDQETSLVVSSLITYGHIAE